MFEIGSMVVVGGGGLTMPEDVVPVLVVHELVEVVPDDISVAPELVDQELVGLVDPEDTVVVPELVDQVLLVVPLLVVVDPLEIRVLPELVDPELVGLVEPEETMFVPELVVPELVDHELELPVLGVDEVFFPFPFPLFPLPPIFAAYISVFPPPQPLTGADEKLMVSSVFVFSHTRRFFAISDPTFVFF